MKSQRGLLIGIIVVLLILAAYAFSRGGEPDSTPNTDTTNQNTTSSQRETTGSAETQETITVTYTDTGFSPTLITVAPGTIVQWDNNSSGDMWVASDPHPEHTDLPGFDAQEGIPPGGTYWYTFSVLGEHGYHNHLNDVDTGTILVE